MKLAEALLLRGDTQKKLASLRERVGRNCIVQDGSAGIGIGTICLLANAPSASDNGRDACV
jgi:hypothetical protein